MTNFKKETAMYKSIDFVELQNSTALEALKSTCQNFIKKDGKYVINDSLELESIINSIFQRNLALQNKDFEKLPFKPKYKLISKDIFFNDIKRYSNVQNTSMQLGGVMGEMWISDIDEESFNWLKLGEIIGVGKQTVFGLGKISIGAVK